MSKKFAKLGQRLLKALAKCTRQFGNKYILSAISVEKHDDKVAAVATDGNALTFVCANGMDTGLYAAGQLVKLRRGKHGETVTLTNSENGEDGVVHVAGSDIDCHASGMYPDWKPLLPNVKCTTIYIDAAILARQLQVAIEAADQVNQQCRVYLSLPNKAFGSSPDKETPLVLTWEYKSNATDEVLAGASIVMPAVTDRPRNDDDVQYPIQVDKCLDDDA